MRLNRFYLENFSGEKIIELKKGPIFHQIKNVLRMKTGNFLSFFYNNKEAIYKIESITNKDIFLVWQEDVIIKNKINKEIILFQSLIKKDKMEWVVQKAVELGVTKIVPIISERSEKKNINLDRLNKISLEASEQCGRQDLIKISEPIKFKDTLKKLKGLSFLGDSSGNNFIKSFKEKKNIEDNINIFIGPEGGWSSEELILVKDNRIEIVKLNNYILRSETASLAFLSLLSNL